MRDGELTVLGRIRDSSWECLVLWSTLLLSTDFSIQTNWKSCAPVDPGKDEVRLNIS